MPLDVRAPLRLRHLLHVVHGELERRASSSTRPTTSAAACSSLYYYAWNGLAPLGGLIVGWLSATGGTELAFTVAGTAGLVMVAAGTLVLRQKKAAPVEDESAEPAEQLIAA